MLQAILRALVFLLFLVPMARAGGIALVLSQQGGPYAEFSAALQKSLDGSSWNIAHTVTSESVDQPVPRTDLIITAGAEALRQTLARNLNQPILATLLPRQTYEKVISDAGKQRQRVSAIYLDQPPNRQAAFLRHLLPEHKRVGILLSNETRHQYNQYKQAFSTNRYSLQSDESDGENTLVAALGTLLPRIDVLLAIPDSTIYKRDNIKPILVTSYRYQRPVVGFSASFVGAGALAAIYSTPTQIANQTAELIKSNGANLAAAQGPEMFAISINRTVANALNLSIPDEATIRRAMIAEREAR